MPSEHSLPETGVGRGTQEEREEQRGKPQDPPHRACPLPDSLQVMQRISKMTEPTRRTEMIVMNPYTHRGMESVVSRTA